MTPKYKIEKSFYEYKKSNNFDGIFYELAEIGVYPPYRIIEENTNKDVTEEFRKYIEDTGFVFSEDIKKELERNLYKLMEENRSYFFYSYKNKNGVIISLEKSHYQAQVQALFKRGYIDIGFYDRCTIFCERNNPNSPIYKFNLEREIPEEYFDNILENSTILENNIQSFLNNIEKRSEKETSETEEEFTITEEDRIEYNGIKNIVYKNNYYASIKFTYKGIHFFYAYDTLAEDINEKKDFDCEILKEVTYFLTFKEFDEMNKLLTETPSWEKFWRFCVKNNIVCYFICYYFLDTTEEFDGKDYPIVKFIYHNTPCAYITDEAHKNENFVRYLEDEDFLAIDSVSNEELEKIQDFLNKERFCQRFDDFCKENNIYNLIPKYGIQDKGFKFSIIKKIEKPVLPEGYSEADEETQEISEEEYNRLSQTLDRFLSKKNPRWCKDGVVEEKFAEFFENIEITGVCGHIKTNLKRCRDEVKNFNYCKNNNALIYEYFRNISKFQNVLQDAINCSNNVYTDFLNIKDFATALMDEESKTDFFDEYNEFIKKEFSTKEKQIGDYTLRNRYKIENTRKTVFERVSFSSFENVFDAVYVTDIKPPFKVVDLETSEDVTEKVLEIAESQNYIFIDTEEIIKKLPKSFEEFKEGAYNWKYLDKKDDKQIKCLNRVNFKHIVGFKDLWQRNCVPFGFKRNFILFVDLNQPSNPVYRIDYRRTSDFESRKLLCTTFEDYISYIPYDIEF